MTSGTRMPTWRERENNKRRERRRRAMAAKIFAGLRMYGNYKLPKHCDNNEVLKALCNEAGWIVEPDGTTYRKGCKPVERTNYASPCSSFQPSPFTSYSHSPASASSSLAANLTTADGQSLIPWLRNLSTSSSSSSSSRFPYLYVPGGSISAPVTPPLSSPTARTPRMKPDFQQNNSFFFYSTPPSPTRQQLVPDPEWFSGIQIPQSVPTSPTFSLVSANPFGFKEASGNNGSGGSMMWTPGQSGTCSPAAIPPGSDQTADVPMSEAVPAEFAFGGNENGLVKAWEGERIHEESGSDDLELTLGNSTTRQ
ncbi:PREDICTED: BES1/BZR1 homolog protein 4 [Tarenaya hassleriana]|uniref:BES1/BZR1 homolog protein 4 n=1 Tax=Tarenaya hassleriana TaxID=28532 RepID=UPI00053C4F47|nr:PREDICTED: BES1/BZR1 homolog protein 4 [Tarenaya hassleriana]